MFKVTQPKSTGETVNCFRFSGKNIILCEMPFKMLFFLEKEVIKKYVSLPYLKFSDLLPETHSFFYLPYAQSDDLSYILSVVQNHLLTLVWLFYGLSP